MVAMEFCGHCGILRHTKAYLCDAVYFSCCIDCGKVLSESESLADSEKISTESIPLDVRTSKSNRIMKKKCVKKT